MRRQDVQQLIGATTKTIYDILQNQSDDIEKLKADVEALKVDMAFATRGEIVLEETVEPTDDKPTELRKTYDAAVEYAMNTHRTVTLRIPKGMRIGEAILGVFENDNQHLIDCEYYLSGIPDDELTQALEELKGDNHE